MMECVTSDPAPLASYAHATGLVRLAAAMGLLIAAVVMLTMSHNVTEHVIASVEPQPDWDPHLHKDLYEGIIGSRYAIPGYAFLATAVVYGGSAIALLLGKRGWTIAIWCFWSAALIAIAIRWYTGPDGIQLLTSAPYDFAMAGVERYDPSAGREVQIFGALCIVTGLPLSYLPRLRRRPSTLTPVDRSAAPPKQRH
jgi:hypothetical protein